MPERPAESLTTLKVKCHAPNTLADSRHQACLVSDRRTARPAVAEPIYDPATGHPGHIGAAGRGVASDGHFISSSVPCHSSPPTTKRRSSEQSAAGDRRFVAQFFFICTLSSSHFRPPRNPRHRCNQNVMSRNTYSISLGIREAIDAVSAF